MDRNNSPLVRDIGNYDLEEEVGQKSQLRAQSNQDSLEDKGYLTATDIYGRLAQVVFNNDDSGNSRAWSDVDHINSFMNSSIMDSNMQFAYYVGPIGYGFGTDENTRDAIKHVCKRKTTDGDVINDHYSSVLDKPFVFISNTETVLDNGSVGTNKKEGGSHWISWVLLPKKNVSLEYPITLHACDTFPNCFASSSNPNFGFSIFSCVLLISDTPLKFIYIFILLY